MEYVYADLIIKGKKTLSKVPENLQEAVKEILNERGYHEREEPTTEA